MDIQFETKPALAGFVFLGAIGDTCGSQNNSFCISQTGQSIY